MTRQNIRLGAFSVAIAICFAAAAAGQQMPPMPKPGPEQEVLKREVGTWDATVEMLGPGGTATSKSTGTETNTLLGGLWLITDFKGDMMGQPFLGHGTAGYDPDKKKYVGSWVDSMATNLQLGESTWDPATQTMSGTMEGKDETGKMTTYRSVTEYKDPDTRVFTMYAPGASGKEAPMMRITYRRKK
jgi:hypothetical protein